MNHYLFSQEKDMLVSTFEKFDRMTIKREIIRHLKENPTDVLEHCKDFTRSEIKRFYGYNILNHYKVNPNNNKVSLIITKGNKEYYRNIEN
jgi:hypothetical protein